MLSLILLLSGTLAVNCQAFLRVCVSQSFSDSDSSPGRYYYYYCCYYFSCSGWSLGSTTTGPSLCGKDVNDVKIFRRERHAQYTSFFFPLSLSSFAFLVVSPKSSSGRISGPSRSPTPRLPQWLPSSLGRRPLTQRCVLRLSRSPRTCPPAIPIAIPRRRLTRSPHRVNRG